MKKCLLLIFSSLAYITFLNAQNCSISDSLSYIYDLSAESFVYSQLNSDPQSMYYDSIYLPQQEINEFLYWISAIWEQSNDSERNEIFYNTKWELSGEKYNRPVEFIIETPLNSYFMDTLNSNRTYSGLFELDSLINFYNLSLKEIKDLSNSTIAKFTSTDNIIFKNIVPFFTNINQISTATYTEYQMNLLGYCNGDIDVKRTALGDTITLQMKDKVNPLQITSYWTYFIDNNCQASLITKSVGECKNISTINELNHNLIIYPNPVQNFLYAELEGSDVKEVLILNTLGESISHQNINNNFLEINVSNLASGVYFLKINNSISKFIKK